MRNYIRPIVFSLLIAFAGGTVLQSCKVLRGDPRKNCNHPKHGEYMMEQRAKKMRKLGRR